MATYYSNGKLLLTGEYGVLEGALALAIPTKYGQSLEITPTDGNTINWESITYHDKTWFRASFDIKTLKCLSSSEKNVAAMLGTLLKEAKSLNPKFISESTGLKVKTTLTFPRNWGLGSSSTLINNIAVWANVNPYQLLQATFGGSGYDIACAQNDTPIHYKREGYCSQLIRPVVFNPSFKKELFFVYLNQKQNSRTAIKNFQEQDYDSKLLAEKLTHLTKVITSASSLLSFNRYVEEHEQFLSSILNIPTVKETLFPDYFLGQLKSLGGWGGDFILATGNQKTPDYFKAKGYSVVIPFKEMVLNRP